MLNLMTSTYNKSKLEDVTQSKPIISPFSPTVQESLEIEVLKVW